MKTISYLIEKRLTDTGKSKKKLAETLGITSQVLSNWLARNSFNFENLTQVSIAMKHDFFSYFSEEINREINKMPDGMVNGDVVESATKQPVSRAVYDALLQENIELYRKLEKCRETSAIDVKKTKKAV